MKFSITSGNPTPEEQSALETALANQKPVVLKAVVKRSVFGLPQQRQPLPHQITYGARRFD
jgi:hypothetical protein